MDELPGEDRRNPHGWGLIDAAPTPEEVHGLRAMLVSRFGPRAVWPATALPPTPDAAPRTRPPAALAAIVDDSPAARLLHAVGRSFADLVALRETGVPALPDLVATPCDDAEVAAVLDWCADADLACIPFGGGTSVVGGVNGAGTTDRPTVVLQTRAMDRVLDVDPASRAAHVQAGAAGPVLESQLRAHDLTMRFFPQSVEMSTLGGWIATRAAGHHATGPVHVDDLVESITAITPAGRWESRRLPGSGAGPSPDRMLLGSEGVLGVVTSAWVRVQPRPVWKGSATVAFPTLPAALAALRPLVQSGLAPSNCRVLDPVEAALNGAGDGSAAIMLVGAESAAVDVTADLTAMVELLADHGGTPGTPHVAGPAGPDASTGEGGSAGAAGSAAAAGAWKRSFVRAPYLRDAMVDAGVVVETAETAATYDRLESLVTTVQQAAADAVAEVCGDGIVTCRITHAYADGAAPYLTVIAPGRRGGRASQWAEVKHAMSEAILAAGGTITHHHGVGRDHRPWYDRQRPDPFALALAAAKQALDPAGVLNPGVLLG